MISPRRVPRDPTTPNLLTQSLRLTPSLTLPRATPPPPRLKRRFTTIAHFTPAPPGRINVNFKENVAPPQQVPKYCFNNHKRYMATAMHPQKTPLAPTSSNALAQSCTFALPPSLTPVDIAPFSIPELAPTPSPASPSIDGFNKIREMGRGKFGVVWLACHKETNFMVALKQISKAVVREQKVQHQIARQIRIHHALRHRNLIEFYGFFTDKEHFYIVSELATGGVAYDLLKTNIRVEEEQAVDIVQQTVSGLAHMHQKGYIHRDIKPQNIILQFGIVKICDLGWAAECKQDEMRKSICGTPLYYCPETVQQTPHNQRIDVWTIGLLAYELIVGRVPFKIWSEFDLPRILEQEVNFPEYVDITSQGKQFILRCLTKDQTLRPTLEQLQSDPFLKKQPGLSEVMLELEGVTDVQYV